MCVLSITLIEKQILTTFTDLSGFCVLRTKTVPNVLAYGVETTRSTTHSKTRNDIHNSNDRRMA